MLRVILDWAPISEGTMGSSFVVPVDPVSNGPPRLVKRLERMLPDTLFFETPKKAFDHPILFRGIGCDELLL